MDTDKHKNAFMVDAHGWVSASYKAALISRQ